MKALPISYETYGVDGCCTAKNLFNFDENGFGFTASDWASEENVAPTVKQIKEDCKEFKKGGYKMVIAITIIQQKFTNMALEKAGFKQDTPISGGKLARHKGNDLILWSKELK